MSGLPASGPSNGNLAAAGKGESASAVRERVVSGIKHLNRERDLLVMLRAEARNLRRQRAALHSNKRSAMDEEVQLANLRVQNQAAVVAMLEDQDGPFKEKFMAESPARMEQLVFTGEDIPENVPDRVKPRKLHVSDKAVFVPFCDVSSDLTICVENSLPCDEALQEKSFLQSDILIDELQSPAEPINPLGADCIIQAIAGPAAVKSSMVQQQESGGAALIAEPACAAPAMKSSMVQQQESGGAALIAKPACAAPAVKSSMVQQQEGGGAALVAMPACATSAVKTSMVQQQDTSSTALDNIVNETFTSYKALTSVSMKEGIWEGRGEGLCGVHLTEKLLVGSEGEGQVTAVILKLKVYYWQYQEVKIQGTKLKKRKQQPQHLNTESQRHCYQSENIFLTGERKVRHRRSILGASQVLKPKESWLCSTWGNFHFKTFDGEIYRFPGICNYLLASHCEGHYEDFNIQIQQAVINGLPTISQLSLNLNELLIEVIDHVPLIHGQRLKLPYIDNGIRIENNYDTLKISVKLMLDISWEQNNTIHLSLNRKYMGETCGLCGNFNSDPSDDLVYGGLNIDPLTFGQLQKLRKPEETCEDPKPDTGKKCNIYRAMCFKQLKNVKWIRCNRLVKPEPYIEAYMMDLCLCKSSEKLSSFCLCSTIAEYSRQCALAGGKPPEWRSPVMCYKTCPANLIYKECSSPCTPTCTNPGRQYLCDGPCVAGCICPEGYVLDDVTNSGCVRIQSCSCIYNSIVYPPGSIYKTTCSYCVCSGGHWNCKDLPCPSVCSVEGGSHITTFDKTQYTFHGKCNYVLAKPCANDSFLVTAEIKKCGYSGTVTCLTRVFLLLKNASFVFEISYDNSDFPYVTYEKEVMAKAGVRICWASSFYMIVYTNLGIYLEVQLTPVMQLYIIIDPAYKEKMCGLCGNWNSIQKDDFRTSSGALESNFVDFANSWKTQHQCINVVSEHKHPCMYGTEIEKYAHYWCHVLLDVEGPFAPCHTSVSPRNYYQVFAEFHNKLPSEMCDDGLCHSHQVKKKRVLQCSTKKECPPSMVYIDCDQLGEHAKGAQCPQSCDTVQCYSPLCVSGCVCPKGLFLSHNGTCVAEKQCPCVHNGRQYSPGESAKIRCDNCMCTNRTWICDSKPEKAICMVYGQGHYITFDNKRFTINGNCEYTLVQDYCDNDDLKKGTFKIITENIPCGTTGTSCSVAITLYLGAHKIILADGHIDVMETSSNVEISYITRKMGIYLVIETNNGLVLVWDQMTSISIHLSRSYQGKVCGLCGNFDGNSKNDFTTRSMCLVENVKEFRDSWKSSAGCPEVYISKEPCAIHPYRMPWAHKMCYIIKSDVFSQCHAEVDPEEYYEACVRDTCACDTGGDCSCYCTAVAAYAQACSDACVCVDWRTGTVCPLFCDLYNNDRQCLWHYKACGASCLKTCRNPSGRCHSEIKGLEGCYPNCPKERPYFNEDEMQCVAFCGCLDKNSNYYKLGDKIESCNICQSCICTEKGIQCHYDFDGTLVSNGKTLFLTTSSFLTQSTPFSASEESKRLTTSTVPKTSSSSKTFKRLTVPTKHANAKSTVVYSDLSTSTSKTAQTTTAQTINPLETFSKPSTHLGTSKVTYLLSSPNLSSTTKAAFLISHLSTVSPTLKTSSPSSSSAGPTIIYSPSSKLQEVTSPLISLVGLSEAATQTSSRLLGIPEFLVDKQRVLNEMQKFNEIQRAQASTAGISEELHILQKYYTS
ncbi:mucin-2-like [Mantella aurantiaca]